MVVRCSFCLFGKFKSERKCCFYVKIITWSLCLHLYFCLFVSDESDDLDTTRLATAPRPGTSLRTTHIQTAQQQQQQQKQLINNRPRTSAGRPLTGMVRKVIKI